MGTSPESDVPRRTPGAPSNVRAYSASYDAITLAFSAPLDNGGEDADYFKIEWDVTPTCNSNADAPNKGSVVVSALSYNYYTITDLSNTTQYYFKVSAANSMGYGPSVASSPSAQTPSLQKPLRLRFMLAVVIQFWHGLLLQCHGLISLV